MLESGVFMPSYIGHSVCGIELLKRLNVTDEERIKFIIGNLVPDIKQVDIDYELDEFINKKNIQRSKRITHFRKKTNKILEYPHCGLFLRKYEDLVKRNIETLAYFFHLYTDYYYFKYFLPSTITFLDKDLNELDYIDDLEYVKINKNNEIIKARIFFSKLSGMGLYHEYVSSNKYFVKKFNLNLDISHLKDYLKNHEFNCYVEEINTTKIYDIFAKIERVGNKIKNNDTKLLIFDEDKLDDFVCEVVDTFIDKYKYLLTNYMKN